MIVRGRYLDKDHWGSIGTGKGISEDLLEGSYQLVRESLPQKEQPDGCE